jgi:hypothetical protein
VFWEGKVKYFRRTSVTLALTIVVLLSTAPGASANSFNWIRPYYNIQVGPYAGPEFSLGRGIDMRNPDDWIVAQQTPYDKRAVDANTVVEHVATGAALPASQALNFSYVENASVYEEAQYLYVYFRASFGGLNSFDAALSKARTESETSHSIYLFAGKEGDARVLTGEPT